MVSMEVQRTIEIRALNVSLLGFWFRVVQERKLPGLGSGIQGFDWVVQRPQTYSCACFLIQ